MTTDSQTIPSGPGKKSMGADPIASEQSETTELFEECSNCDTLFRFVVTREQATRYFPPRAELIQDIFPEIPIPARAVLTQGHICGLCLPQLDETAKDIIRSYIVDNSE